MPDRSPEQMAADGRLAWIIVGAGAAVTLTLLVVGVLALRGAVDRWATTSWQQVQAGERRARITPPIVVPTRIVPYTRPSPAEIAARPVSASRTLVRPLDSPAAWIGTDQYPPSAIRDGAQGRVRVTVVVDPDGVPTGCSVLMSSGYPALDNATCGAMLHRGRFDRAPKGVDGVRRWDSPPVRWVLPNA